MTANNLPRYVVDASVATKWLLRDEQFIAEADSLLAGFRDGRWNLSAPDSLRYEVAGAIRKAVRTNRLTREQGRTAIADFLGWQVPAISNDSLLLAAFDYSWRYGCSIYDGLYLALSASLDCPLIHADRRLRNAMGGRFPRAVWIEDWVPVPREDPENSCHDYLSFPKEATNLGDRNAAHPAPRMARSARPLRADQARPPAATLRR